MGSHLIDHHTELQAVPLVVQRLLHRMHQLLRGDLLPRRVLEQRVHHGVGADVGDEDEDGAAELGDAV